MRIMGRYTYILKDKNGKIKSQGILHNAIVDEGKNHILDVEFHAVTQVDPWYIGLIDSASYTGLSASDTMASHAGWIECIAYSEGTREAWLEAAARGKSIGTATPAEFSINDTKTIKGVFVCSDNAKSGTDGVLWSTALFAVAQNVENGDTLTVTYEVIIS